MKTVGLWAWATTGRVHNATKSATRRLRNVREFVIEKTSMDIISVVSDTSGFEIHEENRKHVFRAGMPLQDRRGSREWDTAHLR